MKEVWVSFAPPYSPLSVHTVIVSAQLWTRPTPVTTSPANTAVCASPGTTAPSPANASQASRDLAAKETVSIALHTSLRLQVDWTNQLLMHNQRTVGILEQNSR